MSWLRLACLILANALIPYAVYVFAIGFFPYKPFLPGLASFQDQDAAEEIRMLGKVSRPRPVFDKVLFMVVDALRSDFVYGNNSGFDFTQSLIASGGAIPFTAHAAPPTVTMPRVKALTTGSVPSFVDFILNFAESDTTSTLATQDTWLAQIRKHMHAERAGRVDFYGDDTWLKLFPDFFSRHDGTTSFFVSDFYEVDNNVTRNMPSILESDEWDGTIVHYLGLDHIGHKTGPNGAVMLDKQREMDGIVRRIYNAMETQDHLKKTLLVLAGDHGMNNGGNHGGSSDGETSTALVFMSPRFEKLDISKAMNKRQKQTHKSRGPIKAPTDPVKGTEYEFYTKISQSDLVPTLSGLLGLPIPKNSLGIFIPELLSLWYDNIAASIENPGVQLMYRNALQMLEIVKATYGADTFMNVVGWTKELDKCSSRLEGVKKLQCLWGRAQRLILAASLDGSNPKASPYEQIEAFRDFLSVSQDVLSQTASQYDVMRLFGGMMIALLATWVAWISVTTPLLASVPAMFFSFMTVTYGIMMSASSYVEEEHRFWYWLTGAWFALLATRRLARTRHSAPTLVASIALLLLHRLMTRWNQTGQKWTGSPDISRDFFPTHHWMLWSLIVATYANFFLRLARSTLFTAAAAVVVPAFVFKLNFAHKDAPELVQGVGQSVRDWTAGFDLVTQARATFYALAGVGCFKGLRTLLTGDGRCRSLRGRDNTVGACMHDLLSIFLITQSRVNNVPLFLLFDVQLRLLTGLLTDEYPAWLTRQFPAKARLPTQSGHTHSAAEAASTCIVTVTMILLSMTTYFAAGGSNAISSLDLSNAYNGIGAYNAIVVGILLFAGNWAGPIWWTAACALHLKPLTTSIVIAPEGPNHDEQEDELRKAGINALKQKSSTGSLEKSRDVSSQLPSCDVMQIQHAGKWTEHIALQTMFVSAALFAVMLSCTVLRAHLFIWTVFSPKFLYAMAWSLAWHYGVGMGVGGILYALG